MAINNIVYVLAIVLFSFLTISGSSSDSSSSSNSNSIAEGVTEELSPGRRNLLTFLLPKLSSNLPPRCQWEGIGTGTEDAQGES